jgi:hypothetical protein
MADQTLMGMLTKMSAEAGEMKAKNAQFSAEQSSALERQRRKSRELEREIFGMGITDLTRLRRIFDEIDEDHSGSISAKELGAALIRAGKMPTREQTKLLVEKYDTDGNGTLEWEEYQEMIKNWDKDLEQFSEEKARYAAALAAAEPNPTGAFRTPKISEEDLPILPGSKDGSRRNSRDESRRNSRDDLPKLAGLDLAQSTNNIAKPMDGITQAERDEIAAKLRARGGNRRRSI